MDDSGRPKRRQVSAYSPADLRDKWHVRKALELRGPSKEIDLASLPSEVRENEKVGRSICQTEQGLWLLAPVSYAAFGYWQTRVRVWCKQHKLDVQGLIEVVSALNPRFGSSRRWWEDTKKALLFVPIDLRMSIENSLERILPDVRAIQENLLEVCGRRAVIAHVDEDLAWRDLYIYLLCEVDGVRSVDVAAEVFAGERPRPAQSKVRTILSRLRREVGEEVKRATQDAQHLRCARIRDAQEDK